jgi:hypothetical protein
MNGTGTKRSSARPTATVAPEKRTARPAVSIVVERELLAEAGDDEQRVVDREAEADQLHEIRDVADHRQLVRHRPDERERRRDRARGEDERNEHGEREAEHRDQHGERDRQRDRLAAAQIAREDRLEVVLDRRRARDVRPRAAGERAANRVRVALRVLEVERRVDLAVEDAVTDLHARRVTGGHELRRAHEPGVCCRTVGFAGGEDDREHAFGPFPELAFQDEARTVGVAVGDGEDVREQRAQAGGREHADHDDDRPGGEHRDAEAQDGAGPAGGH